MGRKSTVETLPSDILKQLQALLLDPRVTQLQVTHKINALLAEQGHDERVSKSAVGRYAKTFEELTAEMVETDRMATLMMAELNITNQSDIGQVTSEALRVMIFRLMPLLRQELNEEELDIKAMKAIVSMIKDLTAGTHQLEHSATLNEKLKADIERNVAQKAMQAAADNVGAAAKQMGLNAEQVQFWREQVLGVQAT